MTEPNAAPRSFIWPSLRWLIAGEVLIMAFAADLTLALHQPTDWQQGVIDVPWRIAVALAFGMMMTAVMHALGMHVVRARRSGVQLVFKYCTAALVAAGLLWLLAAAHSGANAQAGHVGSGLSLGFGLLLLWRLCINAVIDSGTLRRRVVVLGAGRAARVFNEAMRRRADRRGIDVIGYLPLKGDRDEGVEPAAKLHSRTSLARLCERNRIDEVVVASDDRRGDLPVRELLECRFRGVRVTQAATFIERECGRIPIELVEPSWWLYRNGFTENGTRRVVKRLFDVVAGSVILALATPLMIACAVAILVEDGLRASVFFRQVRVGHDGREFWLIKFRSMREDAESDGIARWARSDDERVTRVGRVLRKTRLDELPQLFNVLRGEMSLVGPRPERPEFVRDLVRQIPYYERRHAVRPGITGWAQLCYPYGASTRDALEKLKFDLYYIKNHSIAFDIAILLRTVEVVLFGKGAR